MAARVEPSIATSLELEETLDLTMCSLLSLLRQQERPLCQVQTTIAAMQSGCWGAGGLTQADSKGDSGHILTLQLGLPIFKTASSAPRLQP